MKDKSLEIILLTLFGTSGIALLILAWLQPMAAAERALTVCVGSAGLLPACIRAIRSRLAHTRPEERQAAVRVEPDDKPAQP